MFKHACSHKCCLHVRPFEHHEPSWDIHTGSGLPDCRNLLKDPYCPVCSSMGKHTQHTSPGCLLHKWEVFSCLFQELHWYCIHLLEMVYSQPFLAQNSYHETWGCWYLRRKPCSGVQCCVWNQLLCSHVSHRGPHAGGREYSSQKEQSQSGLQVIIEA